MPLSVRIRRDVRWTCSQRGGAMTEHQDNTVGPETNPPATDDPARGPNGASDESADTFTLAGPGSDPAAPAVQPVDPGSASSGAAAAPSSAPSSPPSSLPSGNPGGVAPDYDKYGVPSLDYVRNKI